MRSSARVLIAGSTLSQLGNWVNVTAVMVLLQEQHGAAMVSAYFLVRTIAPFLLARPLVSLVHERNVAPTWAAAQVVLSMTMLALAFLGGQLAVLLGLLAFAGILQSASASWLMHIANEVSGSERKAVVTAISTGTSVALVVGPALGGLLALGGGLLPVFCFDAATFAAAVFLVPWRLARPTGSTAGDAENGGLREAFVAVGRSLVPTHPADGKRLRPLAIFWVIFGLFGGILTASETPVFSEIKHLNADQIGVAISAYGLGGLTIFIASTFFGFSTDRLASAILIVAGVTIWALFGGWFVYLSFFVIGLGFSLVNSAARVSFGEAFDRSDAPVSQSWAWVNQLSLLTSVVSYVTAFVYFSAIASLVPPLLAIIISAVGCASVGVRWDSMNHRFRADARV